MTDARVKIQPAVTEKVFVRLTAGQMEAVRNLGTALAETDPLGTHRWLHRDGSVNVSAVLRHALALQVQGFHQL